MDPTPITTTDELLALAIKELREIKDALSKPAPQSDGTVHVKEKRK
jgi:hypothetical protein